MTNPVPSIYQALAAVMEDVQAVAKKDKNSQQNFNFRGIDAVLNAVGPAFRTHKIVVTPSVVDYTYGTVEVGRNNTKMAHVVVKVSYQFTGPSGDALTSVVIGEAMDSGDKAIAKAMSVAFRTCLLQTLALPTDEPDPDTYTYERSAPAEKAPNPAPASTQSDDRPSADASTVEYLISSLADAMSIADLGGVVGMIRGYALTPEQRKELMDFYAARKAILEEM